LVTRKNIEDIYPLSSLQEGIYYHVNLDPSSPVYWNQLTARIGGAIDADHFRQAWESVIDHHPALRTSIFRNKKALPIQVVATQVDLPWAFEDWTGLSEQVQEDRLNSYLQADRFALPNLRKAPLMRVALFKLGHGCYRLVWSQHHIILDGWSGPLVLRDVFESYRRLANGEASRANMKCSFAEYVHWTGQKDRKATETFWREYFRGFESHDGLMITPTHPSRFNSADEILTIAQTEQLTRFARDSQVSVNILLQCAWAMVLAAETGQTDVTFGVTISDRPPELEGIEETVGLLLATVPVIQAVASTINVSDWLRHSQQRFAGVCQHSASLGDIHSWSGRAAGQPLFDSLIVFENFPFTENLAQAAGMEIGEFEAFEFTHYPLTLTIAPGEKFRIDLTYLESAVSATQARRMLERLCSQIENLCSNSRSSVGDLRLVSDEERVRVKRWHNTNMSMPHASVMDWFAETARQAGDKAAVCFAGKSLSYAELDRASSVLAQHLVAAGVQQDQLVAVGLPRSEMLPVVLLGVLRAGAGYIPLDLTFPAHRLNTMLSDSACDYLISEKETSGLAEFAGRRIDIEELDLFGAGPDVAQPLLREPGEIAYLIYTSGSTGKPKGVCVGQRQLLNLLYSMSICPGLVIDDSLLALTTLSFDIAVLELLGPLMVGATVHIASAEVAADVRWLAELIEEVKPTVMQATPATWSMLLAADWQGLAGLKVLCGGEALDRQLANRLLERVGSLWNMYGPTETTVWSACGQIIDTEGPILVGHAIANTQLLVLNANQQPVPVGVTGELYVGGHGVAEGYWQRDQLTQERFVAFPQLVESGLAEPEMLWFKTGDMARWHADGAVEVFGRIDNQIKVRGFRIEPGEIESALREYADINDCCVVLRQQAQDSRLIAYYVAAGAQQIGVMELRKHLSERLPSYMIPQQFTRLDKLPLTLNAKVDRKELLARSMEADAAKQNGQTVDEFAAPSTPSEKYYATMWQELLEVTDIGVNDTFFDLGGHSLLSMRFVMKVSQDQRIDIPLLSVLLNTLGQLALRYPIVSPNDDAMQVTVSDSIGRRD
jgi:amino acid adenylation domain-containing protein